MEKLFCIFIFFVVLWKDNSFIALFHESAMYIKYWNTKNVIQVDSQILCANVHSIGKRSLDRQITTGPVKKLENKH